ncbi:nitronate monooxygenase [Paenibacillus sp. N4]|nr:nitronate monooxygenase [Paenibacillus vietnamensis]
MDGRGLVAALALGAQGVQMGTRFLTSFESGAHEVYKDALLQSNEESTVITKAFSGRPARGIVNKFINYWDENGVDPLPFPDSVSFVPYPAHLQCFFRIIAPAFQQV